MKLSVEIRVTVLDSVINNGKDNKQYYNLTVFDSVSHEAGTLQANETCFNSVQIGKVNRLLCEYNDRFNSFRAVSVIEGK